MLRATGNFSTDACRIHSTLAVTKDENQLKAVIDAFAPYFKPQINKTFAAFKFSTSIQREGENFDAFLTELKVLAKDCNFGKLEDRLIRDKIVTGIRVDAVRANLLCKPKRTYKEAAYACIATACSAALVKVMSSESEATCIKIDG
ncbi:uncharacterized protein B4U80_06309 [Leptotrombidium deliense]|uniref:Uncharacterized protein n=1 Tax=Leptotrombidium deliense TaxID=299467 RepID=A0A443S1G8_9ACAR|nr:uncharacterized protein B4U80_06309 [Leptotrombidium deliense]